ncbi:MAG: hypothetical protein JWR02_2015 [Mucilaginibacter sp.]|nr:hypothetical protein [Mucilaginibacter sp.]
MWNNKLLLKKCRYFLVVLKNMDSFVANNRQSVLFNTQFVDLIQQTKD